MKVFVLFCLATLALGGNEVERKFNKWATNKAMESCYGKDNRKIWTVQMKKAVAKCTQQDAPELSLPEYQAPYKTVNALLDSADNRENNEMIYQIFKIMHDHHEHQHYDPYNGPTGPYKTNIMQWMMKMMMEKDGFKNKEHNHMPSDERMDRMEQMVQEFFQQKQNSYNFQNKEHTQYNTDNMFDVFEAMDTDLFSNMFNRRFTRQADLDLGDRLVEKLQAEKETMEQRVGNMTCILQELHLIDKKNNLDIAAIKNDMKTYNLPSVWFKNQHEQLLDTCYEMATTLPADVTKEYTVTGDFGTINMAQIKTFMGCCHKAKAKLCMNYDIMQKIEENFGPVQDILDQSGLTESQLFPLVESLLQGQESELDYLM